MAVETELASLARTAYGEMFEYPSWPDTPEIEQTLWKNVVRRVAEAVRAEQQDKIDRLMRYIVASHVETVKGDDESVSDEEYSDLIDESEDAWRALVDHGDIIPLTTNRSRDGWQEDDDA